MALENKIDETLTESISILKQVTLSLFNIRFTNFPQIKKLLDHVLWEGVIKNGYRMVRLSVSVSPPPYSQLFVIFSTFWVKIAHGKIFLNKY